MPSSRWLRRAIPGMGIAVLLVLTSCSSSDDSDDGDEETITPSGDDKPLAELPPAEIAQRGIDALRGAGSARFVMEMSGAVTLSLDIRAADSEQCTGQLEGSGGTIEIVQRGEELWARPDERLWAAEGAGGHEYQDMYIHGPTDHPHFAGLQGLCSWDQASNVQQLDDSAAAMGTAVEWSKGKNTTVAGQPALTVHRQASTNGLESEDTMRIAAEGEPYLLGMTSDITGPNGQTTTQIEMSDIGDPVDAPAPPADRTVEADELGEINPFNDIGI